MPRIFIEDTETPVIVDCASRKQIEITVNSSFNLATDTMPETITTSLLAAVDLEAFRVVAYTDAGLVYADQNTPSLAHSTVGILLNSVTTNAIGNVETDGVLVYPDWNWDANRPLFVGDNGQLTQDPTGWVIQQVAIALSPTKIIVDIQEPVILG